jgi:hypothetical protein
MLLYEQCAQLPQLGDKGGFQPARAWSKKANRHSEINIRTMSCTCRQVI